jgi:hypothetical protein
MSEGGESRKPRKPGNVGRKVKSKEPGARKVEEISSPKPEKKTKSDIEHPNSEIKNKSDNEHPKSEIKKMEVHHHPQLEHKPKPWKEYLLEGFMIFVAVTMGFFAESFREHLSDRSKEQEYLSSLAAELKYDTSQYNAAIGRIIKLRPLLDSAYHNAKRAADYNYILLGKWNTPINEISMPYMPALVTIRQMNSSGSLRLVGNKDVAQKIVQYEALIEGGYKVRVADLYNAANTIFSLEDELCDESKFNDKVNYNMKNKISNEALTTIGVYDMPILVRDPLRLNRFANSMLNYKSRNWGYITGLNGAKTRATELLNLIKKNYDLGDE